MGSWRWKSSEVRSVGKFSGDKFVSGKKAMKKLSVPAPTTWRILASEQERK